MSRPAWRPTAALTRVLVWVLGAFAVGQVIAIPFESAEPLVRMHAAFDAALDGRSDDARRLFDRVNDGSGSSVTSFVNLLGATVLVLLAVWGWRTATNARAQGRTGERISPVLGVFGWFVPLASLVIPYLVVSDLWRSSDPAAGTGSRWRELPGTVLVRAWWICFAGGQAVTVLAVVLAITGENGVAETETLLRAAHTLSAAGAVLTIAVVTEITRRQAIQRSLDPASTPAPSPTAARRDDRPGGGEATPPGAPGWYPDPSRGHDERYWDGAAWTERVRSNGVSSFAPVTPADWYPDPTGRFPLRYWTGYSWTEHVSRDNDLYVDPVEP